MARGLQVRRIAAPLGAGLLASLILLAATAAGGAVLPSRPSYAKPETSGRLVIFLRGAPVLRDGRPAAPSSDRVSDMARRISGLVGSDRLAVAERLPAFGAVTVKPRGGEDLGSLRSRLKSDPRVALVETEYRRQLLRRRPPLTPNDPALLPSDPQAPGGAPRQWYLLNENFRRAWRFNRGGRTKLAIIDSGIDAANSDFGPRLVATVDQDAFSSRPGYDSVGHGTHVAGLACASGDDGVGMVGAAYRCRLISEKTDLTDSSIAASIYDATERGARVISMSLGGPGSARVLEAALDYAYTRDVVLVAAAENDPVVSDQGEPASYLQPTGTGPNLQAGKGLVVTAAQFDRSRARFAGRGSQISIAAYGAAGGSSPGIFSRFPANQTELDTGTLIPPSPGCGCRTSFQGDSRYAYIEGTSMATPQVAGAAALLRSFRPKLSALRVRTVLKQTASGRGAWNPELGWGIVNPGRALRSVKPKRKRRGSKQGSRSGKS
jgi:serine protease